MKFLLNISFLLSFLVGFSQENFQDEPKEFKKIHFVYEEKSNYFLNDTGVYADTLLFAFDFPKLKYTKVKSPFEANMICGFLPYSAFSDYEDKRKLVQGQLYHANQSYEGTYYVNKNKTKINVIRDNKEIQEKVKKYFNDSFRRFTFEIKINYSKESDNFILTSWFGYEENLQMKHNVTFFKVELSGFYTVKQVSIAEKNIVVFNKKLNVKVVPAVFFSNSNFGVQKIETLFTTIELKSVTYE